MENQEQIEIKETDVLVIGAGPVGLFSVFQCGMLGLKCHVVDSLPDIGGQCTALYPEKPIYDIPGFPSVMGAELIQNLEAQAKPFEPVYHMGEQVCTVEKQPDGGWCVSTDKNTKIFYSKSDAGWKGDVTKIKMNFDLLIMKQNKKRI